MESYLPRFVSRIPWASPPFQKVEGRLSPFPHFSYPQTLLKLVGRLLGRVRKIKRLSASCVWLLGNCGNGISPSLTTKSVYVYIRLNQWHHSGCTKVLGTIWMTANHVAHSHLCTTIILLLFIPNILHLTCTWYSVPVYCHSVKPYLPYYCIYFQYSYILYYIYICTCIFFWMKWK